MSLLSKKICIVGESGVGKNSLIRRFVDRKFSNEYLATLGVTISRKTVELPDAKSQNKLNLQLMLWDVTGEAKFQAFAPQYLRGSSGAVVVADASRQDTIERLPAHIQLFLSVNPKSVIFVALNKCDLILPTKLESLIPRQALNQVSGLYPTSAKTGTYVDEIFQHLAYKILESGTTSSPPTQPLFLGEGQQISLEGD
jgi:small GTP-binding protein